MREVLFGKCGLLVVAGILVYGVSNAVFAEGAFNEQKQDGMNKRRSKMMERKNKRGVAFGHKRTRGKMSMLMSRLTDDEKKELEELRKTDRDGFRKKIRELVKKYKKQLEQEQKEVRSFAKKIRNADTEAEKSKLKEELRSKLRKQFDAKMAINRRNYKQAGKRLEELKKRLDAREAKADVIIERRLQELTEDPDLKW